MGYCISLMDDNFFISGYNKVKALQALKTLAESGAHLSWVYKLDILESETLEIAMEHFNWPLVQAEDLDSGNIDSICFAGEKSGSEDELFTCLAPFVRHGSWIELQGEDGASWRYYFMNGKYYEITPTITWNIDHREDV